MVRKKTGNVAARAPATTRKTRVGRAVARNESAAVSSEVPTTLEGRLVDSMSLFVRWARRELHDKAVVDAGFEIDRSSATILGALYFHEPVRVSDLADHLGLDRSTVSRQVAVVVDNGWVRREGDTNDARAMVLTLTTQGHAMRRKLASTFQKVCLELIADWKREDRNEFVRLLDKLAEQFRDQGVY